MVFNAVLSSISVISRRPMQLSMHSWSSLNQYSAQYSFQATGCYPTYHCRNHGQRRERNESFRNDYHQSSEGILAESGIEPAISCSQEQDPILYVMSYRARHKHRLIALRHRLLGLGHAGLIAWSRLRVLSLLQLSVCAGGSGKSELHVWLW